MPGMNMMPNPDNHEAAMARADLYKMANYSFKLFKMIHDGQELEGWVQAKITKAADYVASVYHFMEYEMKFSEYGNKLENSDMYTEDVKEQFKAKLLEARQKLDKLKKKNEKDLEEELKKVGDTEKTHKGGTVTKTDKGITHKRDPNSYSDEDGDEKSGKGKKSHAKSLSAAEKKAKAPAQKQSPKSAKTWGMKDGEKFDNRVKEATMVPSPPDGATAAPKKDPKTGRYPKVTSGPNKGKEWSPKTPGPTNPAMKEALKGGQKKLDVDKDGKLEKSDFAKLRASKGVKEASHQEKTTMKHVKNPTAGEKKAAKDIKPGVKGYSDRVAMLKSAEKDGRLKEGSKPDFLDMDKDGNKKEPMKKAVADKKKNPFAKKEAVKESARDSAAIANKALQRLRSRG